MKITPSRTLNLLRPAVIQIDGKLHVDGREYDANWAPTGLQVGFPAAFNTGTADFNDLYLYSVYGTYLYEHGRFYMQDGSMTLSDKPLVGSTTSSGYGVDVSTPLNHIQGYLYLFDSRLPYHFNSVSGLTAGKKYIALNRGIVEVKPKFKRGMPAKLDVFVPSSYNRLTSSVGVGSPNQQLILGESETELFGIAWNYQNPAYTPPVASNSNPASSIIWRSTKRIADIDNATAIQFTPNSTSDCFDFNFIGMFGDYAIGLRLGSDSAINTANSAVNFRPAAFNTKTGATASIPAGNRITYYAVNVATVGVRFHGHVRSVVEKGDIISLYVPVPTVTTDALNDGTCMNMPIYRYDFSKVTGLWTIVGVVSIADGAYGDIIAKGPIASGSAGAGTMMCQTVVASWIIQVKGVNHLVVVMHGTNSYLEAVNSYVENTHQYVYRMNADDTMTRVSKIISPRLFGLAETQAGWAMSKDRRAMYINTYSPRVYRFVFDESIMAYRYDLQYEIDAWTMHVADDETLSIIDTSLKLVQLKPSIGTAVRATFGAVLPYDGVPQSTTVSVAVVNHLGARIATSVKLELDGPVVFTANASQTLTIVTSADGDLEVPIQVTGTGNIYCTPVKP